MAKETRITACSDDPNFDSAAYVTSPRNSGKISVFVHKGDLVDGLNSPIMLWAYIYPWILFRCEQIPGELFNNSPVYKILYDVSLKSIFKIKFKISIKLRSRPRTRIFQGFSLSEFF